MTSGEFDRQVENLIGRGYPELAGVEPRAFAEQLEPLRASLPGLPAGEGTRIPFVIAVKSERVPTGRALEVVDPPGFTSMEASDRELRKHET